MTSPLRVLLVENSPGDRVLMERALKLKWPLLISECVQTATAMQTALQDHHWDCVISDMIVPGFGALDAVKVLNDNGMEIPLIIASGVVNFEDAITVLREGAFAFDFVRKDNLARLVPSVEKALENSKIKQQRKETEIKLHDSETMLRATNRMAKVGGWEMDAKTAKVLWTSEVFHIFSFPEGRTPDLKTIMEFFHDEDRSKLELLIEEAIKDGKPYDIELQLTTVNGENIWARSICKPIVENGKVIKLTGTFQDITHHKHAAEEIANTSRLYATLAQVGSAIIRGQTRHGLLSEICNIFTTTGNLRLAWVGLLNGDGKTIESVAYAGEQSELLKNHLIELDDDACRNGSIGKTIETGKTHTMRHVGLTEDGAPCNFQGINAACGSWSVFPISVHGKLTGVLSLCSPRADYFNRNETELIEHVVSEISFAMEKMAEEETRRQIEETLQSSEKRYRDLLNALPVSIHELDFDGKLLSMNSYGLEMIGVNQEKAIIGKPFIDLVSENDHAYLTSALNIAQQGHPHRFHYSIRSDERQRSFSSSFVPVIDTHGEIERILGISEDRTERIRIKESLHQYAQIVAHSEDFLALVSKDFVYIAANDAYLRAMNKSRSELIGCAMPDILGEDFFAQNSLAQFEKCLAKGKSNYQSWFDFPELGRQYVDITYYLYQSGDSEISGVIASARVITEQKLAVEKLKKSEQRFLSLFEASPIGMLEADAQGNCVYVNEKWRALSGLTTQEAMGQGWCNALHKDDRKRVEKSWNAFFSGQDSWDVDYRFRRPDGTIIWLSGSATQLYDEDGKVSGFLGANVDITDRKNHEQAIFHQVRLAETIQKLHASSETLTEKAFAQCALGFAEELTDSRISFLHMIHDESEIELYACSKATVDLCCQANKSNHYPIEQAGVWSDAIRNRAAFVVNDYTEYEDKLGISGGHVALNRVVCVPVFENDKVVMLVGVGNKEDEYAEECAECLQTFADEVWRALQRRRLERKNLRFSKVIEQSLSEVYIFDASTLKFVEVNLEAQRNVGHTPEQMMEMTPLDLKPFLNPDELEKMLKRLRTGQQQEVVFDTVHRRKDETMYPVEVHLQYLEEDPPAFVANIRDITDRLEMESQLRKLAQAVEQSPASIVITNLKAEIEYVNKAFLLATGYSEEEVIGKNPRILHSGDTSPKTFQDLWGALSRGKTWQGELFNQDRFGNKFVEHAIISPIRNSKGVAEHYLAVKSDISENKKLTDELETHRHRLEELVDERTAQLVSARATAESASMAKSLFLANMSHEIRTPMNAIIGLTHLLQREDPTENQRNRLTKIDASASHLLSLISDILDLSKIEAGKLILETTDFNVDEMLESIHSLCREQLQSKHLDFDFDRGDVPSHLSGDSTRLRQALLNYVTNAVKFTEHGGIALSSKIVEESRNTIRVRFEVRDTGMGIAPEKQQGLFKPFQQADSSITRTHGGTGLGLVITQRLVELMNGEVGVESDEGHGSTFWFVVQLGKASEFTKTVSPVETAHVEKQLKTDHSGASILLVEDNAINRDVAVSLLSSVGLNVDEAENGSIAVSMASNSEYDLILMDIQMPVMDGLQATRQIQADQRAKHGKVTAPILAMSANVFEDDRRKCEAAGMVDFIAKPVIPRSMFMTLLQWLPTRETIERSSPNSTDIVENQKFPGIGALSDDVKPVSEQEPVIDPEALSKVFGDDTAAKIGILKKFAVMAMDTLTLFETAYANRDDEQIGFQAHKLKSSARTIGANELADFCYELEVAGVSKNWDQIDKLASRMRPVLERVVNHIAKM